MVKNNFKKNIKHIGGDGYVVNVNEPIGGRPSFPRYSNNYRPIFDGELLQNGDSIITNNINTISDVSDSKCNNILNGGSKKKNFNV